MDPEIITSSEFPLPEITTSPEFPLLDQLISIKVSNLQPNQHVTLMCSTKQKKFFYLSWAHFVASPLGTVDSTDPSLGGSYVGHNQMGIWSHMQPMTNQKPGLRYIPVPSEKAEFKLQVLDSHVGLNLCELLCNDFGRGVFHDSLLAEHTVTRKCYQPEHVDRCEVYEGRLRGTIFRPKTGGPYPGIIELRGGAGGIAEGKAAVLSSHGFVTYSLPYFRYQDLPTQLTDQCMEYFLEAIDYLCSQPDVQAGGIGLVGLSYGGNLSLHLSCLSDRVRAVVSIGGWSYPQHLASHICNKLLPVNYSKFKLLNRCKRGGVHVDMQHYDEELIRPVAFPLHKTSAKYLYISGEEDLHIDAAWHGRFLGKLMKEHGQGARFQHMCYPGAGHFIDVPYIPTCILMAQPAFNTVIAVGGEVPEQAMANEQSWRKIIEFLKGNLLEEMSVLEKLSSKIEVVSKL